MISRFVFLEPRKLSVKMEPLSQFLKKRNIELQGCLWKPGSIDYGCRDVLKYCKVEGCDIAGAAEYHF